MQKYKFGHETYQMGLIIKPFPPVTFILTSAQANTGPFAKSASISKLPF
jgi:hypothetical protein